MGHFWITKWIQRAWYCWGITFPRWGYPYGPFPCNPLGLLWHRRCGRRTAAADVGRKSQALRIPPLWFHNFHLPTLVLAMKLAWSHISEGWFWVRPPPALHWEYWIWFWRICDMFQILLPLQTKYCQYSPVLRLKAKQENLQYLGPGMIWWRCRPPWQFLSYHLV